MWDHTAPSWIIPHLLCLRNARAFPLLPAALASVPFGFVLVRVRVRVSMRTYFKHVLAYDNVSEQARKGLCACDVTEWLTDGHRALLGCQYKTSTMHVFTLLALYLIDLLYERCGDTAPVRRSCKHAAYHGDVILKLTGVDLWNYSTEHECKYDATLCMSVSLCYKHVLAYDNVSEQARKRFLSLWCDWRTQFSARTFVPMSV